MGKDLVALVADVQQEKTLETLLSKRQGALGIPSLAFDIYRHPRKDPGVFHEAPDFLWSYQSSHVRALALLDAAWAGAPGSADFLRATLLQRLQDSGWPPDRCQVVVIEPELEMWVWVESPAVPEVLRTSWPDIHQLGRRRDFWREGEVKPHEPKALLEAVLRQQRRPRSAAIFQELAQRLGLASCTDPAFVLLRETLARWFGPSNRVDEQ